MATNTKTVRASKKTVKRATKKGTKNNTKKVVKNTEKTVLVLRTCKADLTATSDKAKGFKWPEKGPVECPDWDATPECGHGLHGLLWGMGDARLLTWDESAKWLVVEVLESDVVGIDSMEKVKFPKGNVVCCGDRKTATDYLLAHAPAGTVCHGAFVTVGDKAVATSGDRGTSNSGNWGTSTSGDSGTSNSGYGGTSTSGYRGTSTSGYGGTSNSGEKGILNIKYWDEKAERYRIKTAYVGEDGIEPNVKYKLDDKHNFVKA